MTAQRIDSLLDHQLATRPEGPALTDNLGHSWSYADLGAAVDRLAAHLCGLGVGRTDRVLLVMENCAPAIAALFAAARIGAAIVPCNARQSAAELDRIIAHAQPAAILFTSAVSAEAAGHAARHGAIPLAVPDNALASVVCRPDPAPELSDVAAILYTTGTTGPPKGVMLTHANLIFGGRVSARIRGMVPEDVIYGVLPVSHVFGLASVIMAGIGSGALIQLAPRFDPARLYQALAGGVTMLSAVPQMHAALMRYTAAQGQAQLPSARLRYVSSGAAPLDPDWKRRAEAFFGLPLQNGYGMTETTAGASLTRHAAPGDDISVGPPLPGVGLRIDHHSDGAQGGIGEVLIHGGGVMKGYFRNPEASAAVLSRDGWLRSGDLGRLDAGGNLHIAGRLKELIIHGGFNVYPPEVEAALNDHPQVVQCAVIGHRVAGDEQVVAFIEAAPETRPTEAELRDFAARRLTAYKRPARFVFLDKLPAAPTGKILKGALAALIPQ